MSIFLGSIPILVAQMHILTTELAICLWFIVTILVDSSGLDLKSLITELWDTPVFMALTHFKSPFFVPLIPFFVGLRLAPEVLHHLAGAGRVRDVAHPLGDLDRRFSEQKMGPSWVNEHSCWTSPCYSWVNQLFLWPVHWWWWFFMVI